MPQICKTESVITSYSIHYTKLYDAGPGSYTGLRIGISAVKAMCFTLNKKCAGISTLESLAYNCIGTKVIIVSLMKARNDVAYYGIYKSDGKTLATLHEDSVQKIDEIIKTLNAYKDDIILTGDYAEEIFNNYFKDNINISLAPVFERHQLATSLCFLAMQRGLSSPDELSASYLQITKAEKDKNTNNI